MENTNRVQLSTTSFNQPILGTQYVSMKIRKKDFIACRMNETSVLSVGVVTLGFNEEIFKLLIENGANVETYNSDGSTPL